MSKYNNLANTPNSGCLVPFRFEVAWQLPYLIKSIYAQLEAVANAQLVHYGISIGVWRILAALWNNEELTNRELAHYISIDVTNISRLSRSLQKDGLIHRRRTEDDQRTVRIRLSKKGKDLVERIIPHAEVWQKEVIGDFSQAEMAALMQLLNSMDSNLRAYSERQSEVLKMETARSNSVALPRPNPRKAAKRRLISLG